MNEDLRYPIVVRIITFIVYIASAVVAAIAGMKVGSHLGIENQTLQGVAIFVVGLILYIPIFGLLAFTLGGALAVLAGLIVGLIAEE